MEDTELKSLLQENLHLAKENNKMLRAMGRRAWYGFMWKIVVWAIILGLPIYLYYAYLPVVQSFMKPFISTGTGTNHEPTVLEQLQDLAKKYKGVTP